LVYSDSNWTGDSENHIIITGFIIHFFGTPLFWSSKSQIGANLYRIEAEYVAMSEAVKEISFVYYLLVNVRISVKLPTILRRDNIGAIVMTENPSSETRIRHIDIRYHFLCKHVVDGVIKIIFVKKSENDADIFTKNVNKESYEKNDVKFLGKW
jgi:hypothetical protein